MPKAALKLIVTGDDFGYCPKRNQGIVDCFLAGAVSNVSLLVNGSAVSNAAQLAKRFAINCKTAATSEISRALAHPKATNSAILAMLTQKYCIPIGLHANLSEGSPVCPALKENSSLLNEDGFFHGKMGIRTALAEGVLKMSEVKQELTAQVDLFCELMGHTPHHMDGHQHVHVLPEIRHVFAQVMEDYGITYTRVPIEPDLPRCNWIDPPLMDFYLGVEKDSLDTVDVFRKHGIRWPDIYIGLSTMGKNMSVGNILGAIDNATAYLEKQASPVPSSSILSPDQEIRTVTIELMTHPGYPSVPPVGGCGQGPDDFSQSWERLHELETLKTAELRSQYQIRNIQLCAFKNMGL